MGGRQVRTAEDEMLVNVEMEERGAPGETGEAEYCGNSADDDQQQTSS